MHQQFVAKKGGEKIDDALGNVLRTFVGTKGLVIRVKVRMGYLIESC